MDIKLERRLLSDWGYRSSIARAFGLFDDGVALANLRGLEFSREDVSALRRGMVDGEGLGIDLGLGNRAASRLTWERRARLAVFIDIYIVVRTLARFGADIFDILAPSDWRSYGVLRLSLIADSNFFCEADAALGLLTEDSKPIWQLCAAQVVADTAQLDEDAAGRLCAQLLSVLCLSELIRADYLGAEILL